MLLRDAHLSAIGVQSDALTPQLFLWRDHTSEPRVVKFLADQATIHQQRMFQQELLVLKQLSQHPHPNLMSLLDMAKGQLPVQFGGQSGQYYVMPYASGGNLSQLIHTGLNHAQIIHLLHQVITAVDQLHQCGWLHLDLKPANFLLLDQSCQHVLLTDFALARPISEKNETTVTEVQGTPAYMSPEQFQGVRLNKQTDYYALGLVCYALLTGQHPFQAQTYIEWAQAHCQHPVPLLPVQWRHLQPWLDGLLAKDRQYRVSELNNFKDLLY